MTKSYDADQKESSELRELRNELKKHDAEEAEAWKIKSDKASNGREKIKVPDRWY